MKQLDTSVDKFQGTNDLRGYGDQNFIDLGAK